MRKAQAKAGVTGYVAQAGKSEKPHQIFDELGEYFEGLAKKK